jgi:Do/DeqQ family serine protease
MGEKSNTFNRWRSASDYSKGLLVLAIILLSVACKANPAAPVAASPASSPVVTTGTAVAQNSYADVVSRVAPAVVTVRSTQRPRASRQLPFMDDPLFREFFGDRLPQPRPQSGLGSGVIVSPDGYILTNHHVIEGADKIRVELADRRTFDAKLVGSDPPSDLAVLKIDAGNLPVLPLGDSDKVRVGDVVLAVGNPLGIGQTVTSGIVSAKGRSTGAGDGSFEDFIQTDAPINRGNSGGPLINTNGELIGINSQILTPTGGNIGIGFAIPSNMARSVMEQLIKTGKVRRSMLGITVQPVTSDIAASLGLQEVRGIIVGSVQQGSPAERAGIRRGDVITALNGAPITDSNSFRNQIAGMAPGTEVTLTLNRDGREQQVKASLVERTDTANREDEGGESGTGGAEGGQLGLSVEPLTPAYITRLRLREGTQGLVVTNVDPTGPAAEEDIRPGDVIEQVNRQPVRSVADLRAAVGRSGNRPVLLLINRQGNTFFVTVRPRK